jgi:hypothetical protein
MDSKSKRDTVIGKLFDDAYLKNKYGDVYRDGASISSFKPYKLDRDPLLENILLRFPILDSFEMSTTDIKSNNFFFFSKNSIYGGVKYTNIMSIGKVSGEYYLSVNITPIGEYLSGESLDKVYGLKNTKDLYKLINTILLTFSRMGAIDTPTIVHHSLN